MLDFFACYNGWYKARTTGKHEKEEEKCKKRTKCKPFVILSTTKSNKKYTFVNYGHLHTIIVCAFQIHQMKHIRYHDIIGNS